MKPRRATMRKSGLWQVSGMVDGKRVFRYAATGDAAIAKFDAYVANRHRGRTDGLRAKDRRERAKGWIALVLQEARTQGCQLSPRRIKRNVFGPCVYCGTWRAQTIDHVIPTSLGGRDTDDNIVSACWSCNSRKGDRSSFKPMRPRPFNVRFNVSPLDAESDDAA